MIEGDVRFARAVRNGDLMRAPVAWLREFADVPADATGEDIAAALVRVGLEEEGLHGGGITGPLVVGRVLTVEPEPQKNGKTINWCTVDVGDTANGTGAAPGDRLRRPQLRRRRPRRRRPARRRAARWLRDLGPQDLRPRLRRHDLLGPRARPRRRPRRHPRAAPSCSVTRPPPASSRATTPSRCSGSTDEVVEVNVTPDRGYCFSLRGIAREYAQSTGASFRDPADLASSRRPQRRRVCRPARRRRADPRPGRLRPLRRPRRARRRRHGVRPRAGCRSGSPRPGCARSRWPSTSPTT